MLYHDETCQRDHWRQKGGHRGRCGRIRLPATGPQVRFEWTHNVVEAFGFEIPEDTSLDALMTGIKPKFFDRAAMPECMKVDCATFMQILVALCHERRRFAVGIGAMADANMVLAARRDADGGFYVQMGDEHLGIVYMTGATDETIECMREVGCGLAGQWLAGPDAKGRYLGMCGVHGVVRQTLTEWQRGMTDRLERAMYNPTTRIASGTGNHNPFCQIQAGLAVCRLVQTGWRLYPLVDHFNLTGTPPETTE